MPKSNVRRKAKLATIRQMIANAGLADALDVVYDSDHSPSEQHQRRGYPHRMNNRR